MFWPYASCDSVPPLQIDSKRKRRETTHRRRNMNSQYARFKVVDIKNNADRYVKLQNKKVCSSGQNVGQLGQERKEEGGEQVVAVWDFQETEEQTSTPLSSCDALSLSPIKRRRRRRLSKMETRTTAKGDIDRAAQLWPLIWDRFLACLPI